MWARLAVRRLFVHIRDYFVLRHNGTEASLAKHDGGMDGTSEAPYSADALARLVREAVRRIASDLLSEGALSYDAHAKLLATSAHAFRHTFGTRAVARDMPIDVVCNEA